MTAADPWEDAHLCTCGKRGWTEVEDANRAYRIMRGRARKRDKSPRTEQLTIYPCRTTTGTWHVGHNRRQAAAR